MRQRARRTAQYAALLLILLGSTRAIFAQSSNDSDAPPSAAASEQPSATSDAPPSAASEAPSSVVSEIRVIGNRRIPKETILARMFTKVGDTYDPVVAERDFNSLWNTGYFENVQIDKQDSPKGVILTAVVRERPTIREINYKGLSAISQSDVLDRFKKEKVALSVESQYDPTKIKRAETVLKQLLGEHGHQFATIRTDVKTIPPAAVSVNFNIKEGPMVKVGHIRFVGNKHISSHRLRNAMRNLKPIGIPHSYILEDLFAHSYDESKLEDDTQMVRQVMRDRGYFKASVDQPLTHIRNQGGISLLTLRPRKGKSIDITMPIEEGERYRLGGITFTGNKAVTNLKALRGLFKLKDGEVFNASVVGKGLENMRKAYGTLGYINFTAVPTPRIDEAKKLIFLNVDIDEGKPYYISRIEFRGNTITRDRVIRRELLVEEGQVYNSQLWEMSLLRLNQLNYFSPLKADQDSETHQDADNGTVDLLLKVHEKGKNSVGLNGGFSGLSGPFLGANYQTNNFLGLGETLSVQTSVGDLQRNITLGFTEPYIGNHPLTLGFQIVKQNTDYNSTRSYRPLTGGNANFNTAQQSTLQNFNQGQDSFSVSANYPIRRTFQRVGATYSLSSSNISAFSPATSNLFQFLNFRHGTTGQTALHGIVTSQLSLSYSYNTIGNPYRPRTGKSLTLVLQGSGLGGNVSFLNPTLEYKFFKPMHMLHFSPEGRNVFGARLQASYVQGIAGLVAPPFDRFFTGGENDIRGFDIRSATPYAFIPTKVLYNLTNPDGTLVPKDPTNPTLGVVQIPLPIYALSPIGGDTQITSNLEYRIPVTGIVTFALYSDFGLNMALNHSQLQENPQASAVLNSGLYGCPIYTNGSCQGGTPFTFPNHLGAVPGTNIVPRWSVGPTFNVMAPVINAPIQIYFAFNPARLHQNQGRQVIFNRSMFPQGGAGDFTYEQALAYYGSQYFIWEPRKTFRVTMSTSF